MKTSELVEKIKHAQQAESEGKTTIRSMKRHNVNDYIHPTQKPVEIVEKAIYNSIILPISVDVVSRFS